MSPGKPPAPTRVLMIGPAAPAVGGMASVMQTLVASPLRKALHISVFPNNPSWGARFGRPAAIFRHLALLFLLAWRVLRQRIDLVHIHTCSFFSFYRNLLDLALLHLLRRKVILHVHGHRLGEFHQNSGPLGRALIRAGLQRADAVVVLSQQWRRWITTTAPQAHVRVIHNGVPVPPPPSKDHPPPHEPCRFLYLGLMDESKGLFDLLAAASQLLSDGTPFQLTLAGPWSSSRDEQRFRAWLRRNRLADTVRYVGVADDQHRDRLLARAHVFVLPSHGEAMPMSILEAMSHALPVIATDVGAVAETVGNADAGLIIEPGDTGALARAMSKLSRDPPLRQTLGHRARQRIIRRYSDTLQAQAVLNLYKTLLSPAPHPALLPYR